MRYILAALLFWVLGSGTGNASPEVRSEFAAQSVKIGETTVFDIYLRWPAQEGEYRFAMPKPVFENLLVLRQGEALESILLGDQHWRQKSFRYVLKPLEKGEGHAKPTDIFYKGLLPEDNGHLEIPGGTVRVESAVPKLFGTAIGIAAGGFVSLTVIVFALGLRRVRKNRILTAQEASKNEEDPLIKMIEGYEDSNERIRDLGEVLRRSLIDYYNLDNENLRPNEIIRQLYDKEINRRDIQQIQGLLTRISEIRFAGGASEVELSRLSDDIAAMIRLKSTNLKNLTRPYTKQPQL